MPKKVIPPEIKAQIIQTIKDNPNITIPELKERFNFDDGRVLVGIKKFATGRIVPRLRKEEEIKQDKQEVATETIVETEKKNLKPKKEDKMEKEELTAILEQVKTTARETIKALKAEEQQTAESLAKEKDAKDTLSQIKQLTEKISSLETKTVETDGRIKTVCETFPGLCEKVEALAKKLETPPPAPPLPPKPEEPKKKGILETGHDTLEDLLSCPECLLGHIKKIGFDKAAVEICKDDETCKAAIAELTKKGYKIEEPKKEETSEGKDKEGKEDEGTGTFHIGKGPEEAPAA